MALSMSMISAVAGLRTHQSKMDVIGNNIANVNTPGYKGASMTFQDTMYQTNSSGAKGNTEAGGYGGSNANQVGYGVTTGAITYDFTTGGKSASSWGLDCMIDGSGFFIVGPMIDGTVTLGDEDSVKSSGLYLSRVGKFQVDGNGYLTDAAGNYVYGFANTDMSSTDDISKTALAPLKMPTQSDMVGVNDKKASSGVTECEKNLADAKASLNSVTGELATARQNYADALKVYNDAISAANVETLKTDLAALKTALDTAEAAYNADTSDATKRTAYYTAEYNYQAKYFDLRQAEASVNAPDTLAVYTTAPSQATAAINAYQAALTTLAGIDPSDTTPANVTAYNNAKTAVENAKKTLTTIEDALDSKIEPDSPGGALTLAKQVVEKYEEMVKKAEELVKSAESALKQAQDNVTSTSVSGAGASEDTLAEATSYTIENDGSVVATIDGTKVTIGKIALAIVQNTGGLEKSSGYYYSIGSNAGNVSVSEANTNASGKILGNALEQSTVDLATEMTEMITTQRGFQANSKIITVTDTMLEELVNLKR